MTRTALSKVLCDPNASVGNPQRHYSVRAAARARAATIADAVIEQVCHATQILRNDMLSESRRRDLAEARQIAAWMMRQENVSMPLIAHNLGLSDHTTVLHAVRKVGQFDELNRIARRIRRGDNVHDLCMRRWNAKEIERQQRRAARPRSKGDLGADLIEAGTHSHRGAAREIGCHPQTIRNACQSRKLPTATALGRQEAKEKISEANRRRRRPPSEHVLCRQARALLLHEQGLTHQEIAEAMSISRGSVSGLISRARRRLALQSEDKAQRAS